MQGPKGSAGFPEASGYWEGGPGEVRVPGDRDSFPGDRRAEGRGRGPEFLGVGGCGAPALQAAGFQVGWAADPRLEGLQETWVPGAGLPGQGWGMIPPDLLLDIVEGVQFPAITLLLRVRLAVLPYSQGTISVGVTNMTTYPLVP